MEQDRRTFLKSAALAAGYVGLAPLDARSFAAVQGANDRVRVVVVGFSDRFRGALLPSFLEHHKATNFDIVGVCDIWNRRRDEGKAALEKAVRPSDRDLPQQRGAVRHRQGRRRRHHQHGRLPARAAHRRGREGRQGHLHREAAGRDDGGQPRRAEGRAREQADRADRIAAAQRPELHRRRRVHQAGQVRPDRLRRSRLERQPARPLAPARARRSLPRGRHRLEALSAQPPLRAVGSAEVPRVPPVLALLVGHSGAVDGAPDRHGPLVLGLRLSAQRRDQRRHLLLEGRPHQRRHDDHGARLRPGRQERRRVPGGLHAHGSATAWAARRRSTTRTAGRWTSTPAR